MSNKPTHRAVTPIEQKSGKPFWQDIGSAWKSDKCINIKLNCTPINGEIVLFEVTEKEEPAPKTDI